MDLEPKMASNSTPTVERKITTCVTSIDARNAAERTRPRKLKNCIEYPPGADCNPMGIASSPQSAPNSTSDAPTRAAQVRGREIEIVFSRHISARAFPSHERKTSPKKRREAE